MKMRTIGLVLFIVMAAVATTAETDKSSLYNINDAPQLFEQFIKDNDRHYKDEADRQLHYDAFLKTLKYVNEHNAKESSYTLGITLFADLTDEERKQRFGGGLPDN